LPAPRVGYWRALTDTTLGYIKEYIATYGADQTTDMALRVIETVLEHHRENNVEWPKVAETVRELRNLHASLPSTSRLPTGAVELTRAEVLEAAPQNPEAFFATRRSVRKFGAEAVSHGQIQRALSLARTTPSVCNRQGARVYVYTTAEGRAQALSFQDGNAGFGEQASVVFVVTSDMSVYYKNAERNQAYVDGGMYAMTLALALHAVGLGACILNWSMSPRQDRPMRQALGIPDNEVVIAMLVAGSLLPRFTVAASPRRPLEQVATWEAQGIEG